MKQKAICLHLHVHQPYRVKHYTIFDAGSDHHYFNDEAPSQLTNNRFILDKIAQKSYIPTNRVLQELLDAHPQFKLSLSITGTLLDQLETWTPEVLKSFQDLVKTGRVELLAETYHHSLAFFYSRHEFEEQVKLHRSKIEALFGVTPVVFRNTELSYNNDIAYWAEQAGFKGVIAEGCDAVLGWRSPNFVYRPAYTKNIRLLMKNYKLSDDIAFRFSNKAWGEWPLTVDKYADWLGATGDNADVFNLFMDYETFGEHQWADTGIFDFLRHLPEVWLERAENHTFMTLSEAINTFEVADTIDTPQTTTWADTERDLSAWLGNSMQRNALQAIYELEDSIVKSCDASLIEDWRLLQTSDHYYYMCTKGFGDGDVHAYFSPYDSPYEAFANFMNAYHDLKFRLAEKGLPA